MQKTFLLTSHPLLLHFSAGPVHFHYYSQSTNQRFHTHPAHLPALLPIVTLQDPPSGPPGTGPSPPIMATLSRTNQSQPACALTPLQYVLTSSYSLAFLPSDLSLLCYRVPRSVALVVLPIFKRFSALNLPRLWVPCLVFSPLSSCFCK